jgi:hypothetical protein
MANGAEVAMALGKRDGRQQELWVATTDLPQSPGHPFDGKPNERLAHAGFDQRVEELCEPDYDERIGRPSIPRGVYYRMIFVGFLRGSRGSATLPGGAATAACWLRLWATVQSKPLPSIRD